jgi:hypothetical protein
MSERDDEPGKKDPEAVDAPDAPPEDDAPPGLDDADVKDLLRGALRPPTGSVAPSLLHGVQRRIRSRSRGKFYGDGWSTARAPRSTYLMTSIIMLALVAFIFLVLIPWSGGALP